MDFLDSELGAELEALTACFFEAHSFGVPFDVLPCFMPAHVLVGFGGVVLCAEIDVEACGEVAVVENVFVDVWEVVAPLGRDLCAVDVDCVVVSFGASYRVREEVVAR